MEKKFIPEVKSNLRHRMVHIPEAMYKASGITVLGKRIKTLVFTTDIAIINNTNGHAIMAVYPFTPTLSITNAIIMSSSLPVFAGVGGGITSGIRSVNMALQAEMLGAYGVIVNAPMKNETIVQMKKVLDIPIVATIVSAYDDIEGKINSGADILNVSGGKKTAFLVEEIRKKVGYEFPIIATGGDNEQNVIDTINAGANALSYTPPTSAEIFHEVMANYRQDMIEKQDE